MTNRVTKAGSAAAVAAGVALAVVPAAGAAEGSWVTAWSAAPQGKSVLPGAGETFSGYLYAELAQRFVKPPNAFDDQTVRQVMYLHQGGNKVRVRLSNQFGESRQRFPSTRIGVRAGDEGAEIERGTSRRVTFKGRRAVSVPRGKSVLSDPIDLDVDALDHAVLSIYVPKDSGPATVHANAAQTFYTAPGNRTANTKDEGFTERGLTTNRYTSALTTAYYYASEIRVLGSPRAKTLVTFGDSITDGFLANGNQDARYPDQLARRLQADPATRHLSVANQAVSGGRVTEDSIGPSSLKRLDREVLSQPNLGGVMWLQGINDLGNAIFSGRTKTADELIEGYREVARRVKAKGVPIYIGTLTPAGDVTRPTPFGLYSTPSRS